MKRRNHLILLMLTITALSFAGCGTQTNNTENSVDNVESVQTLDDDTVDAVHTFTLDNSTVDNSTEESSITDSSAASEDSSNVTESAETSEADAPEESIPEETKVEMVDFETWATQEGNEEVCLVVWNEELGVQEIMPTWKETEEIYEIQNGDKFAIPFNDIVTAIHINDESYSYSATANFFEVPLIKGELNKVIIFYKNEDGETKTKGYMLK